MLPDDQYRALRFFMDCVEGTGGVIEKENGFRAPVADPEWTDLGEAYMYACRALGIAPRIQAAAATEETEETEEAEA